MGWTTPTDRSTLYTVTAADWNIVEDDLAFLYGDTGWTNVSGFTNSWVSSGGSNVARYIKMGNVVKLAGGITSGSGNNAAFTLPAGYRPSQQVGIATSAANAFALVTVSSAGVVASAIGALTSLFLDPIMFSVL